MLKISDETIEIISDGIVDLIRQERLLKDTAEGGGGWQSKENLEVLWHNYIKRVDPHEKKYIVTINSMLTKQAKEVFDKIKRYPNSYKKWMFDRKKWLREFAEAEAKFIVKLYKQEGQKAIDLALKLSRKSYYKAEEIPISIAFDVYNPEVTSELLKQTKRFPAGVVGTSEEIIRREIANGLELGESIDKLRKRVTERLGPTYIKNRAEMIARSETIYASNAGAELGYMQSGVVEGKKWLTAVDERTCDLCLDMDGRTAILGTSFDIESLKEDYGWKFDYSEGAMPHPPLHPRSYSKDTEIYTKNGWKNITEIKIGDECLSLNDIFNLEYQPVVKTYKHYENDMIRFKNRNTDLLVTKDHHMFYQTDWNGKHNQDKWKFVEARELLDMKSGRMYRSSKWIGKARDKIKLGKELISFELYCEFMGWYLSEGSTVTSRKFTSISQSKSKNYDKWCRIEELLYEIGFKFNSSKEAFAIHDKELYDELTVYGKCNEKYIPSNIKDADKKYIRIFLDAYRAGDGSTRKNRAFKGGNFEPQLVYFTTSDKMADDLGELILKIGHRPSYYIEKRKGKEQRFGNGTYIINHDLWVVRECYSNYLYIHSLDIKNIPYQDFSYCIDIANNHTLYVRRNGKCLWSGNCRCTIIPIVETIEKFKPASTIKEAEDYIQNKLNLDIAHYGGIKLDYANTINEALIDLKRKYPDMFLGKIVCKDMGIPSLKGIMSHGSYIDAGKAGMTRGTLYLNRRYFDKFPLSYNFNKEIMRLFKEGWMTPKKMSDLVVHEMGHHLTFAGRRFNSTTQLNNYHSKLKIKPVLKGISKYAESNFLESLAEAFVKYNRGDKISPEAFKALQQYLGVGIK